ncbi:MAG: PilN domain-containing protein [Acidobacteriota bacterium]
MIKINLIAEGKKAVTRKSKGAAAAGGAGPRDVSQFMLLAGLLVGLLAWGGYWYYLKYQIGLRQDKITVSEAEVRRLESIIKEIDDYKIKKAALEHKISVINQLKQNQQGPVRIMDQISRALPELLWLDSMEVMGNNISVSGNAFNINAIANFIENLDKAPEFQEPILRDSARAGQTYNFGINFIFNMTPPAAPGAAPGSQAPAAGHGG